MARRLRKITDESGLILQSNATLRELVDRVMAGFVGCLWSLLALAMLVASFGVVNTLTMNVLEQTRELALLRVVAMTRRQVRRTVLGQAAIVGLISLVPGTVIGVFLAYLVIVGSAATLGHWLDFDAQPTALLCSFVGAYVIVLAAALAPARRAARLELLAASTTNEPGYWRIAACRTLSHCNDDSRGHLPLSVRQGTGIMPAQRV